MTHGAKAENLASMWDAGLPIPPFYVIEAKQAKAAQSDKTAKTLLKELNSWRKHNGVVSVIVRSSSDAEDSDQQSFAGQFTTVLDVRSDADFIDAVIEVANSSQDLSYAKGKTKVHVIVQQYIQPDFAGVAFSVNPATGGNEFVINLASGHGKQVVDGGDVKQVYIDRLSGVRRSDSGAALPSRYYEQLTNVVKRVEDLFGTPQDIEWLIKDGKLSVVQARPITTINHLRLWDSSNISESFPGIVCPLTFSIASRGYQLGYKAQAYEGGLSWYELEENEDIFNSMIGIFNGRMFYNLLSWYRYISLFPGSANNQKFLDAQIETQGQSIHLPESHHSFWRKLTYYSRLAYRVPFYKRELKKFYRHYDAFERNLASLPPDGDLMLLMNQYRLIQQTIVPHFGRTLDNDFLVMALHGWLKRSLETWLPQEALNRSSILGSISGVMSAEQALSLYSLAELIQSDKQANKLLKNEDYEQLDEYVHETEIGLAIEQYKLLFGHRFAEDQKIESINLALSQHGMYELLKPYAQLNLDELKSRIGASREHTTELERTVREKLGFWKRSAYAVLLWRLKTHLRIRERNRLLRGKTYGYMRELFPKVGRELAKHDVIESWDDVYYLRIEEIEQLVGGASIAADLKGRVVRRRDAYKKYDKIDMPVRFVTSDTPALARVSDVKTSSKRAQKEMNGLISSPGTIEGTVVVLDKPEIPKEPFDILVVSHTDPGWTPLIALAKGVVVEHGGMLSHAAIVTRELGIPSIIGVTGATKQLKNGMQVRINTQLSQVEILK